MVTSSDILQPSHRYAGSGATKKYYAYLSRSGLAGLVIMGTNSEAFLLTREERAQLIATER